MNSWFLVSSICYATNPMSTPDPLKLNFHEIYFKYSDNIAQRVFIARQKITLHTFTILFNIFIYSIKFIVWFILHTWLFLRFLCDFFLNFLPWEIFTFKQSSSIIQNLSEQEQPNSNPAILKYPQVPLGHEIWILLCLWQFYYRA